MLEHSNTVVTREMSLIDHESINHLKVLEEAVLKSQIKLRQTKNHRKINLIYQ